MKKVYLVFLCMSCLFLSCSNDDSTQEKEQQNLDKMYAAIISDSMVNATPCTNPAE
ncbi:hypothetical protein [Flavobacterium restrictum]|uniref:hypothetical protein n=1 Tax=Flavobacterium restrictum TaxID=2594428 RepID=UPI00163D3EA1|nr:hypothetical protein [Flavobacterium restrictum]